jgi:stearoyl-CoA desaturase (delta-9 desaturase)
VLVFRRRLEYAFGAARLMARFDLDGPHISPGGDVATDTPVGTEQHQQSGPHEEPHNDIVYPEAIPFVLVHLAALGVFWTGVTATSIVLCVLLYVVRMWALTAGFHRYFSHRSYKTSRIFQFVLAFMGQSSAQRGVLWWAAIHRHHHRHSDTPDDVHSPRHAGFFFSHVGWIFSRQKSEADYSLIPDFARYPELRFLDRHPYVPAFLLAVACFLLDGWAGLIVGFFLSTVVLYHGTFAINSLAHVIGKQRYLTGDDSRNNWWLAVVTLGEGWHNNHHHYQSSTRQGFFWWEIDVSYYVLKAMAWTGLVWNLRAPPAAVVSGEARVGRKTLERAAREIADGFSVEGLVGELEAACRERPGLGEIITLLRRRRDDTAAHLQASRDELVARLKEISLPGLPSADGIRELLAQRYRDSANLDQVAERARELLLERVVLHIGGEPSPRLA